MIDRVLGATKDIVVLGRAGAGDKYVFAVPLKGEVAEHYFKKTLENGSERDADGFKGYWQYNAKTGEINGSSAFLTLRADKALRQDGFWIPTIEQALVLDEKRKLTNNVYRDFGAVVYSEAEPNKKTAGEIIAQAGNRELPLAVSFRDMDYELDKEYSNGIKVYLVEAPVSLLSGEQAQHVINKMNYKGSHGACRVDRDRDGYWDAFWGRFDNSYSDGRVDWMCGEAALADLESAHESLVERTYNIEIKVLEIKREQAKKDFLQTLN